LLGRGCVCEQTPPLDAHTQDSRAKRLARAFAESDEEVERVEAAAGKKPRKKIVDSDDDEGMEVGTGGSGAPVPRPAGGLPAFATLPAGPSPFLPVFGGLPEFAGLGSTLRDKQVCTDAVVMLLLTLYGCFTDDLLLLC